MATISDPRELFLHELGDVLYVEQKLVKETIPMLIGEVQDDEFKKGLQKHLEQTKQHIANVEQVFDTLGEEPETEECIGFEGLAKEHEELVSQVPTQLIDLVDTGAVARTEHYEIAAYESLIAMARALGQSEAVGLLEENLKDEKETLKQAERIAKRIGKERAKELTSA